MLSARFWQNTSLPFFNALESRTHDCEIWRQKTKTSFYWRPSSGSYLKVLNRLGMYYVCTITACLLQAPDDIFRRCYCTYHIFKPTVVQRRRQENSSGGQTLAWKPILPSPAPIPFLPVPQLPFSLSSPSFISPTLLSPSLPSPLVPSPLRSRLPKIQLEGLGERCKLPQRGLGRSPSRQTIWCILALKSDIWWQQF